MNKRTFILLFFFCMFFAGQPVRAEDVRGSKDHPFITRFVGADIVHYEQKDFDEFLLPLGPYDPQKQTLDAEKKWFQRGGLKAVKLLEGKVTSIRYRIPQGKSTFEVFKNYENALKGAGFSVLFQCFEDACGKRFGEIYEKRRDAGRPGMSNSDFMGKGKRFLAANLERPEGKALVSLYVLENTINYLSGHAVAQLDVIEMKPMKEGQVTINADAMAADINKTGHVAIYGIYFDSGKSDVKPESEPTLAEIAKLLKKEGALKLHVVGHTDNMGTLDYNTKLSRDRAGATVNALTSKHGIDRSRLQPHGVAFLSPVGSNDTEEGRAKNRRVELVKQ